MAEAPELSHNQPATALGWRHALQDRAAFRIRASEPERALAEAATGCAADLYLIAADILQPGPSLITAGLPQLQDIIQRWNVAQTFRKHWD